MSPVHLSSSGGPVTAAERRNIILRGMTPLRGSVLSESGPSDPDEEGRKDLSGLEWAAVGSAGILLWAGQLKQIPPFTLLRVDLTVMMLAISLGTSVAVLVKRGRLPNSRGLIIFSFLLILSISGSLHSTPEDYANEKVQQLLFLTLPMAAAALTSIRDRQSYMRFIGFFLGSAAYVSLSTLIVGEVNELGRLVSSEGSTITFSRASGSVLVACGTYLLVVRRIPLVRLLAVLSLSGLEFFVLVGIGSRGPFQAMFFAAVALMYMQRHHFRVALGLRVLLVATAGVAIGAAAWVQAPGFARERIVGIFTGQADGRGGGGRDLAYAWTWKNLTFTPFGEGWGSWGSQANVPAFDYVHNIFLEIWFEAGLVGLCCFLLAMVLPLRAQARRAQSDPFGSSLALSLLVFWIAAALVSGDMNGNRTLLTLLVATIIPHQLNRIRHNGSDSGMDVLVAPAIHPDDLSSVPERIPQRQPSKAMQRQLASSGAAESASGTVLGS